MSCHVIKYCFIKASEKALYSKFYYFIFFYIWVCFWNSHFHRMSSSSHCQCFVSWVDISHLSSRKKQLRDKRIRSQHHGPVSSICSILHLAHLTLWREESETGTRRPGCVADLIQLIVSRQTIFTNPKSTQIAESKDLYILGFSWPSLENVTFFSYGKCSYSTAWTFDRVNWLSS